MPLLSMAKRRPSLLSADVTFKSSRKGPRQFSLQRIAIGIFCLAVIATFTSVTFLLGELQSDASLSVPSHGSASQGVSIGAIHLIQQAKSRALHRAPIEKPHDSCIHLDADVDYQASFSVFDKPELFSELLIPIDPDVPHPRSSTSKASLTADPGHRKRTSGVHPTFDSKIRCNSWQNGQNACYRWSGGYQDLAGALGVNPGPPLVGLQYLWPKNLRAEVRREGWNDSESHENVMMTVGRFHMAVAFWKRENDLEASGWVQLQEVDSLALSVDEQIAQGPIIALVPDKAEVISFELCWPLDAPWTIRSPHGRLGLNISLLQIKNLSSSSNTELRKSVSARCEIQSAPVLHYVLPPVIELNSSLGPSPTPTPAAAQESGGIPLNSSFPIGRILVTWHSNCNAASLGLAVCLGGAGPCEVNECQLAKMNGIDCPSEAEKPKHKMFPSVREASHYVTAVKSVQVTAASWLHSALAPELPPGHFSYRIRTGDSWSRVYTFRNLPPPLLPGQNPNRPKSPPHKVKKSRSFRKVPGPAKRAQEKRLGTKSAISRKAYERGPVGHSIIDGHDQNWAHIAFLADSQNGTAVFRRHLSHIRTHKPPADAVLHLGDRVTQGATSKEWNSHWLRPVADSGVGQHSPNFGVYGNLDEGLDHLGLSRVFVPLVGPGVAPWYSMVVGNALWIGLDSSVDPDEDSRQVQWLHETLQNVTHGRRRGTVPSFVVVLVHVAPFVDYWDPTAWVAKGGEKGRSSFVRLQWVALFEKHRVDLVVSGHSHVYQRGERNGVMYVVVGGGGGAIHKKRVENWSMYKVTHVGHHYGWIDLSPNKLSWTVYDLSNNPVDHVLFEPDDFLESNN